MWVSPWCLPILCLGQVWDRRHQVSISWHGQICKAQFRKSFILDIRICIGHTCSLAMLLAFRPAFYEPDNLFLNKGDNIPFPTLFPKCLCTSLPMPNSGDQAPLILIPYSWMVWAICRIQGNCNPFCLCWNSPCATAVLIQHRVKFHTAPGINFPFPTFEEWESEAVHSNLWCRPYMQPSYMSQLPQGSGSGARLRQAGSTSHYRAAPQRGKPRYMQTIAILYFLPFSFSLQ